MYSDVLITNIASVFLNHLNFLRNAHILKFYIWIAPARGGGSKCTRGSRGREGTCFIFWDIKKISSNVILIKLVYNCKYFEDLQTSSVDTISSVVIRGILEKKMRRVDQFFLLHKKTHTYLFHNKGPASDFGLRAHIIILF